MGLHQKAYGLFQWLNAHLMDGRIRIARILDVLTFSAAAKAWLTRNLQNVPEEFRPAPTESEEFSHLFVSYLTTSFEVVEGSINPCPGCWCCSYWIAAKHLRPRKPDRKAKREAGQLKQLALRALADELGLALTERELSEIADSKPLESSMFSYAVELQRRARFQSQGEGVLVLWREIAWDSKGRPIPKFRLKTSAVLEAQETLRKEMKKLEE